MPAAIVDSHCHLDYIARQEDHPEGEAGIDPAQVIARAQAEGVSFLVNPSVTPERFNEVIGLAERFENVYAAVAVHPTDVADVKDSPDWLENLEALLAHPKVVAIGETGLDYYWDQSLKDLQQDCFRKLLALGAKHDLPVIVHDREAHEDVHRLISETPGVRGIMHCFSGDAEFAAQMIQKDFYISFAGNVTFKKAVELQEAAKAVPLDRLLVETDSPFLSPMPFRGKPYEEVAQATTANAKKVFGLC
jgi:TatD DNase family protein